ncbi:MAG: hypothetical protein R6U04_04620 [Bacteroidales bacterium]
MQTFSNSQKEIIKEDKTFVIIAAELHKRKKNQKNKQKERNIREIFSKYEVEMDFGKRDIKTEEAEHVFNVIIKAVINRTDNPQPGYQIFAEGVNVFRIKNPKQSKKKSLIT